MTERIVDVVHRLKNVFEEIPGTQLSLEQASRLAGIESSVCAPVISALEDAHFLRRTPDGRYRHRAADSPLS